MLGIAFTMALSQWLMEPFGFDCIKPAQQEMKIPEKRGPKLVPPPVKPGKEIATEPSGCPNCPNCHKHKPRS